MENSLKQEYIDIVDKYLFAFIRKQNIKFDGWVGNDIGGVAQFIEQYYFSFNDIRMDIDNNVPKGIILDWQNDNIDNNSNDEGIIVNYKSYLMSKKLLNGGGNE